MHGAHIAIGNSIAMFKVLPFGLVSACYITLEGKGIHIIVYYGIGASNSKAQNLIHTDYGF